MSATKVLGFKFVLIYCNKLEEPQEMMPGTFFLKFLDPSGNVVDGLGGE